MPRNFKLQILTTDVNYLAVLACLPKHVTPVTQFNWCFSIYDISFCRWRIYLSFMAYTEGRWKFWSSFPESHGLIAKLTFWKWNVLCKIPLAETLNIPLPALNNKIELKWYRYFLTWMFCRDDVHPVQAQHTPLNIKHGWLVQEFPNNGASAADASASHFCARNLRNDRWRPSKYVIDNAINNGIYIQSSNSIPGLLI
jgi:hypothetical protein